MELELDDDVFFADITKQINLLITDEDDEQVPISLSSSVSFQGLFGENYQASPYMMYQEQINYNNIRESKGTGVFIPRSSQPRRKHNHHHHHHQKKQGRHGSFIPKQQFPHLVHDNHNSTPLNNINKQESITFHQHHHHASTNPRRTYRDAASLFT